MGVVYRARDERLERDVALKVLTPGLLRDPGARRRFRNEALALSHVSHPSITTVLDFDEAEGYDFLVMEYVAGVTLAQRIGDGALAPPEAAEIGAQIADALDEAHERGIVHRDLKPGNILLTAKGRVKVVDFGIARRLEGEEAANATLTATSSGLGIGTLAYMAPEQLLGRPAGFAADLYALGVTLYETLAGRRPYERTLATALVDEILHRTPPSLTAVRPEIAASLAGVVASLLEKDPGRRPTSARAVAEALRAWNAAGAGAPPVDAIVTAASSPAPGAATVRSIAVLPFENVSGESADEFFADGMTDELISSLAQIRALRVISRTSVMRYKGARQALPEIARALGVDAVVEGTVLRSGDRVRILVRLIEATRDQLLLSKRFEGAVRDVLVVQGEAAQAIAQEVRVTLSPSEQAKLSRARPVLPEAYEHVIRGRHFWNRRTEEDLKKAASHFQAAIDADPTYVLAHVGLADAYNLLGFYVVLSPGDSFPRAKTAASRALEMDPGSAEAHTSLAYAVHYYDWNPGESQRLFQRSLELNPGYALTYLWLANVEAALGQTEKAVQTFEKGLALDPLSSMQNMARTFPLFFADRYEESIRGIRKALELDENYFPAHLWIGLNAEMLGDLDLALKSVERAVTLSPNSPAARADIARIQARRGNLVAAAEGATWLEAESKRRYIPSYGLALLAEAMSDPARALDYLDRALAERSHWMVYLACDPRFKSLRREPRFVDLCRKIGYLQV